ncbi:MAG TPA: CoB--CoM heterodisulfide reductase iron-sulfur subunit A family protein [Firmicutes bacterium]|nr:CoB--CoM heterodisulfide reductase iron-sulfur subunit A family protein [Bacillota bacterium]
MGGINEAGCGRGPRIGVYVCHCGLNIAATVDVARVRDAVAGLPGVVVARDNKYTCSEVGQKTIADDIKNLNLDRVVIASCSPRLHERTFRELMARSGLNPFLLEMANIREQCSWVHGHDREAATRKAVALTRAAIARAALLEPLERNVGSVTKSAMVIGGGVAGISAALYLANMGVKTYLVEREPSIGGHMAMLDKTFPTLDCSLCILSPKMVEVRENSNIELLSYTEVRKVEGQVGSFKVELLRKPRYIDEAKCVACGLCAEKCPSKAPDEFNRGYSERKAIYIPFPQAIPASYVIDPNYCRYFTRGGKCRVCEKICERGAVDFSQREEIVTLDVGAIVIATGFEPYDASRKTQYGYGRFPNVITSLDFERIICADGPTHGKLKRPSDWEIPRRIAFIQCVGSRDEHETDGAGKYCSRVCCMITAKQAFMVKEKYPDAEVYVYHTDMRTAGKGFEEFYQRGRSEGIVFVRGKPGEIVENPEDHSLRVVAEDADSGCILDLTFDMVVLAIGLRPPGGLVELAQKLNVSRSADGFLLEGHPKLRPAETSIEGIYLAGCAQFPKDIPDSVAQAGCAAAAAAGVLASDRIEMDPLNPVVDEELCIGCRLCEKLCPYGGIKVEKTDKGFKARVIELACKGCGVCGAACSARAIKMRHYSDEQIYAQTAALLEVG